METYTDYDLKKFDFVSLFQTLFNRNDLQYLHEDLEREYDFFGKPGKDSDTLFHQIFYNKMRSGWPEFVYMYQRFIKEVIIPLMGAEKEIIYQKWPSFRVHLPGNVAVGGWHKDADYNHPPGEINFIVPVTSMFESNTTIAESSPGKMDFHQFEASPGQLIRFNGNQCLHGNLPNKTGNTRVSFDFRVLFPKDYSPEHRLTSLSKGNKFLIGHYYEVMKL